MWYLRYRFKKEYIVAIVVALCLLVATLVTVIRVDAVQEGKLTIQVSGDKNIELARGETYEDLGATAVFEDGEAKQELSVECTGQVNTEQFGTYLIKYEVNYNEQVVTAYRRVVVKDSQAPQILLTENPESFTEPGQPYAEEGFSAVDDVDGDITYRVRRSERQGAVTYVVQDLAGNETIVRRRIRYNDTQPPVVEIQGDLVVSLKKGETYQEPGYTAKDNMEGDITAYVNVLGQVDMNTPGLYTLIYQVRDSDGNKHAAERIVRVLAESGWHSKEPNGKVIYLTFDDGPSNHTSRLLDVLAKYDVKATFFVVDTGAISRTKRMAEEGHTVALHSVSHKYSRIYADQEAYFKDLYGIQGIVEKYTGFKPMILRFPGGTSNTISKRYERGIMTQLSEEVTKLGFRYFDWNVDSRDAGGAKTAEEVLENVITGIGDKKVSVVLQHDLYDYSVDAVEDIIVWGLTNGYTFAPLTEGSPACQHDPNN